VSLPSFMQKLEKILELESHSLMLIQMPLNLQDRLLLPNRRPRLKHLKLKKRQNLLKHLRKPRNKLPNQTNRNNHQSKVHLPHLQLSPLDKESRLANLCQDLGRG
jgi:hypothetical protein